MNLESTFESGTPSRAIEASSGSHARCEPETFNRRRIRYRDASIELVLEPGGRLRRYVLLASEKLRLALGQPRRREIEPLYARQEHFQLRTSELWALGEHQARTSLRLLYARLAEQGTAASAITRKISAARPIGQLQPPEPIAATVCGQLLYAGKTDNGLFSLELLEDGRRVRTITGLDLARALQVAGAQLGDTIVVERDEAHEVSIREEQSGSHGEGRRTLQRKRETFKITKETLPEAESGGPLPDRVRRSVPADS